MVQPQAIALPQPESLKWHRRRSRTVGTFIVGAIIVATVVYVAFGGLGFTTMPAPYVIGAGEPSLK